MLVLILPKPTTLKLFLGINVSAVQCEKWENSVISIVECSIGCYAYWYNVSGTIQNGSITKGCWHSREELPKKCEGRTHVSGIGTPVTICHCRENLCNRNLTWVGNMTGL